MKNDAARPWLSQIEGARSSRDLVSVLRDFLGSMAPDQLGELPVACRAANISSGSEIQEWAVTLAREDLKAVPESNALRLAAAVFAAAGAKLPKLDYRG